MKQIKLFQVVVAFNRYEELLILPVKEVVIFHDHTALRFILNPTKVENMNHTNRLSR